MIMTVHVLSLYSTYTQFLFVRFSLVNYQSKQNDDATEFSKHYVIGVLFICIRILNTCAYNVSQNMLVYQDYIFESYVENLFSF